MKKVWNLTTYSVVMIILIAVLNTSLLLTFSCIYSACNAKFKLARLITYACPSYPTKYCLWEHKPISESSTGWKRCVSMSFHKMFLRPQSKRIGIIDNNTLYTYFIVAWANFVCMSQRKNMSYILPILLFVWTQRLHCCALFGVFQFCYVFRGYKAVLLAKWLVACQSPSHSLDNAVFLSIKPLGTLAGNWQSP